MAFALEAARPNSSQKQLTPEWELPPSLWPGQQAFALGSCFPSGWTEV